MIMPLLLINSMKLIKWLRTIKNKNTWKKLFIGTGVVLLLCSKYIRTVQRVRKQKQRVWSRKLDKG